MRVLPAAFMSRVVSDWHLAVYGYVYTLPLCIIDWLNERSPEQFMAQHTESIAIACVFEEEEASDVFLLS